MPGDLGLGQVELPGERFLNREPIGAERGQGAGGAPELEHLDARADLGEPRLVAQQGREQPRHLETEGLRRRLLQVGARRHRGRAVLA